MEFPGNLPSRHLPDQSHLLSFNTTGCFTCLETVTWGFCGVTLEHLEQEAGPSFRGGVLRLRGNLPKESQKQRLSRSSNKGEKPFGQQDQVMFFSELGKSCVSFSPNYWVLFLLLYFNGFRNVMVRFIILTDVSHLRHGEWQAILIN